MSRPCLALWLGLALWRASPVAAQSQVPLASAVSPTFDDTDPEIELAWLPLGGQIGWFVLLHWPG